MREKGGKKYEEKALLCGCLLPDAFSYGLRAASQASVAALVERDVQALEALAGEIALAGAAGDAEYPGVDRISYDSRTGQVQFECEGSRALHPRQAIMVSIIRPGMFRWASAAQGI